MERLTLMTTPVDTATARNLRRSTARGDLLRIGHGVSTPARAFRDASEMVRHRARIDAVLAVSRPGLIVSHASAVVMHDLPWFGPLPDRVVLTDPTRDRAQRLRFSDKVPARGREVATVMIDEVETTDLVTTAIDVALRSDRGHALVILDAVLGRGVDRRDLLVELESRPIRRGVQRVRALLELADARIESVGESLAHLVMHDLRLPKPELQQEFFLGSRCIARVDFWFPEHGVVVEFDGLVKYRAGDVRGTRTADDVVVAEKFREDAVRAVPGVRSVARLTWREVLPGGDAPTTLRRSGLPVSLAHRTTPAW
ncbi:MULTISPECIES: hypothetical protein [unclassified Curtobacterium]|uniref:hypothetical protein n=1 Tax=unclassified Curtobacterium TaxID=257496 RepID=UPI00104AEF99|nr:MULTISPECIES: hypothetical protein [unclassified Curtobacterium]TCL74330.1 hypothetical protein EDF23_11125 [Curtobacterium sp. PhB128]TCL91674.1 hypothetical protein EDF29_110112 [Curtobacterium sp. PhB138]